MIYDYNKDSDGTVSKEMLESQAREKEYRTKDSLLTIELDTIRLKNHLQDSLLKLKPDID